jgi:hypothetical protein
MGSDIPWMSFPGELFGKADIGEIGLSNQPSTLIFPEKTVCGLFMAG